MTNKNNFSFQSIILNLQHYWLKQGCVIVQPYDMHVGAGTFHPQTFLKAIGKKPCRNAYVQGCRRPTDGRYAKNPNRLQHYFQFQVLIKPSPANIQKLYLKSLIKLGLDVKIHDVRFVEDNWESPTLGATGVGWEVWLDGMEVSQFTYFQQVGGLTCQPISVELTYGLERLAMYLQQVDSIYDIKWDTNLSYGDIYRQSEYEYCVYNFDLSNTDNLREKFIQNVNEHKVLIKNKLVYPSYEKVIETSHVFNMLDARKSISITDKIRYVKEIRAMSCQCAKLYFDLEK